MESGAVTSSNRSKMAVTGVGEACKCGGENRRQARDLRDTVRTTCNLP